MRLARALVVLPLTLLQAGGTAPVHQALPVTLPNDNRTPAGTLRDGVLTVSLDAMLAMWHPDGDSLPGMPLEVFAESGRQPSAPGPLLRVPPGTEIRLSVRNRLPLDTLTFSVRGGGILDSLVLLPAASGELRVRLARPGNYLYTARGRAPLDRALQIRGFLAGALIVDSAGTAMPPRDRVLVLMDTVDSVTAAGAPETRRQILAINGRSWPHTERLHAGVGDTLVWRVLNGGPGVHPMHLHGFFYRVDRFDGPPEALLGHSGPGGMVVTERMVPFTTMTMSWTPDRAGNWLFHCHYQPHAGPHRPLGPTPPAGVEGERAGHANHAERSMGGLVLGIHVRPRGSETTRRSDDPSRRLRLVAVRDAGFPDSLPSMRFALEEPSTGRRLAAGPGWSPSIDLIRGVSVAITVVNRLGEALAVHWHGMELESYFDGVAGFSGAGTQIAPPIAPGDSFEVSFTPPRSGTFIYHSHLDESRHHRAGLGGALIVRDSGPEDPASEHLFFIKSPRGSSRGAPMEINGVVNPDTIVLRAGRRYRLRFVGLYVTNPNTSVYLTARPDSAFLSLRDTMLLRWRPLAKDGADLPERDRTLRPARENVTIGETRDFEFEPLRRGQFRVEVRALAGTLFARVPLRVE